MGHVAASLTIHNWASVGRLDHVDISCDLLLGNPSVIEGRNSLDLILEVPEFEFVALCLVVEDVAGAELELGLRPFVQDDHRGKLRSVNHRAYEYLGRLARRACRAGHHQHSKRLLL